MTLAASLLPGVASLLLLAGAPGAEAAERRAWEETGKATWYGDSFHGRRTASGARFDQHAMTAAHPNLPLGTRVRVTRQDTGASVVVTVNDRQPPHHSRAIDLSRGAAQRIGLIGRGVAWVTLRPETADEPIEVAEAPDDAGATSNPPRRDPPRRPHARP